MNAPVARPLARWGLRLAVVTALALVFAAWLNPHFMVSVSSWVWSCF